MRRTLFSVCYTLSMQCDVIVVLGSGYGQDPRDYTCTPEDCGDEMVKLLVLARRWLHKEG